MFQTVRRSRTIPPPVIPRRWRGLSSTIWTTGASGSLRRKSGGTAAKPTGRLRWQIAAHPPVCNSPSRNAPRRSCKRRSASPTRRRTSWTRQGPPSPKSASWARSVSLTRLPAPGVQDWYSMRRISQLRSGSRGRTRWRGLCRRSPTPPTPRCGRWSRRTPAWPRAISPSAAWKKPWAMGTVSCKTGGRSGR